MWIDDEGKIHRDTPPRVRPAPRPPAPRPIRPAPLPPAPRPVRPAPVQTPSSSNWFFEWGWLLVAGAVILIFVLRGCSSNPEPGTAAYYGVSISNFSYEFYYDADADRLGVIFRADLAATRNHDIRYIARLFDSNNNVIMRWERELDTWFRAAGSSGRSGFRMDTASFARLRTNEQYRLRIDGIVLTAGGEQRWGRNYEFSFTAGNILDFAGLTTERLRFSYVVNSDTNVLDKRMPIRFRNSGNYNARISAELVDSNGRQIASWGTNDLSSGNTEQRNFTLQNCNGRLVTGQRYTIRAVFHFAGRRLWWNYSFTHNPP